MTARSNFEMALFGFALGLLLAAAGVFVLDTWFV
jgi:hypothetical protein